VADHAIVLSARTDERTPINNERKKNSLRRRQQRNGPDLTRPDKNETNPRDRRFTRPDRRTASVHINLRLALWLRAPSEPSDKRIVFYDHVNALSRRPLYPRRVSSSGATEIDDPNARGKKKHPGQDKYVRWSDDFRDFVDELET